MDKKQRMRALLQAYEKNFGMKPRNMRDLVLRLKDPRAWEAQETEAVRGAPGAASCRLLEIRGLGLASGALLPSEWPCNFGSPISTLDFSSSQPSGMLKMRFLQV
mgnify:CR=1 FL=1